MKSAIVGAAVGILIVMCLVVFWYMQNSSATVKVPAVYTTSSDNSQLADLQQGLSGIQQLQAPVQYSRQAAPVAMPIATPVAQQPQPIITPVVKQKSQPIKSISKITTPASSANNTPANTAASSTVSTPDASIGASSTSSGSTVAGSTAANNTTASNATTSNTVTNNTSASTPASNTSASTGTASVTNTADTTAATSGSTSTTKPIIAKQSCVDIIKANAATLNDAAGKLKTIDSLKSYTQCTTASDTDQSCGDAYKCGSCKEVLDLYTKKGLTADMSKYIQCTRAASNNSCYGAKTDPCNSCNDVVNAYKAKGWSYTLGKFAQCTEVGALDSCYDAFPTTKCNSCYDVLSAYKSRGKDFEISKFAQCSTLY